MINYSASGESNIAMSVMQSARLLVVQLYPDFSSIPYDEQAGYVGTWRIKNPEFSRPKINARGLDMSDRLYELAQRTKDVILDISVLPEDADDIERAPLTYCISAGPSTDPEIIIDDHFPGFITNNEGLGFTVYSPVEIEGISSDRIRGFMEYGTLKLDLLSWHDYGERVPYNGFRKKK